MGSLTNLVKVVWHWINVVTDWFLVLVGALLMSKALLSIDVVEMRYVVAGVGLILFGAGLWFRRRRIRQRR